MTIAITGATGHLGNKVLEELLNQKVNDTLVAIVRNEDKAKSQLSKDIEVRYGDYNDLPSLVKSFQGIDKLLFISSPSNDDMERTVQHATVVKAARDAGVSHIYYTSISNADHSTISLAKLHVATEAIIKVSGLDYTFIRNPLYTEVFINPSLKESVKSGKLVSNTGSGRLNTSSRNDIAKATAQLLLNDNFKNQIIDLAASSTWSFQELADTMSKISEKEVQYKAVSKNEAVDYFTSIGLSEPGAQFTASLYDAIEKGDIEQTHTDIERLIDKETTLEEAVAQALSS